MEGASDVNADNLFVARFRMSTARELVTFLTRSKIEAILMKEKASYPTEVAGEAVSLRI